VARGPWRRAVRAARHAARRSARRVAGAAQMVEDPVDHGARRNERHDPHRGAAPGAPQRVDLKDLPQQLGPASTAVMPVAITIADHVATVTFGGTKGNSLPGTLLQEPASTIETTGQRADVHVIVLRSEGDGPFCAGASFDEIKSITDEKAGKHFFLGFARVIVAMTQAPKPVVVRVQGKTVGGGVGIVAAADYAIATRSAAVRLSELALGLGPFVVGPVIEHKIGRGAYGAMSLDADWRDADWAERHGLYASARDSISDLDAAVSACAARLAAANPDAVAGIKRIVWAGTDHWPKLLDERAAMSGKLVLSDYTRNAIQGLPKA
jgi:methylglutaconyl-CoA hydratase